MTTENTENTAPTKKTAPKSKSSTPSTSDGAEKATAADLGFEYDFLPIPADVATAGVIKIKPKDIVVSKVDARAAPALVDDEFVDSIRKDGLIQDPCVTYARHKASGKSVWLIVAGRRRREGSIKAGLDTISCKVKEIKNLREYLILAGQENLKRDQMSLWDKFCFLQNLMANGLKQSELEGVLSVTGGNITQILVVGKLDPRVQKLVREGTKEPFRSYAPSVVRELKRVTDPELQVAFAQQAIEEALEPKSLKFVVEKWLNKQALAAADKGDKPAAKGGRGVKLPEAVELKQVKPISKSDLVTFYNFSNARLAKLKASERSKPETVAYEKGRRDGIAQAAGLVELPALPEGEE
jgi:ParB/RepB/Spo0J family partition protein